MKTLFLTLALALVGVRAWADASGGPYYPSGGSGGVYISGNTNVVFITNSTTLFTLGASNNNTYGSALFVSMPMNITVTANSQSPYGNLIIWTNGMAANAWITNGLFGINQQTSTNLPFTQIVTVSGYVPANWNYAFSNYIVIGGTVTGGGPAMSTLSVLAAGSSVSVNTANASYATNAGTATSLASVMTTNTVYSWGTITNFNSFTISTLGTSAAQGTYTNIGILISGQISYTNTASTYSMVSNAASWSLTNTTTVLGYYVSAGVDSAGHPSGTWNHGGLSGSNPNPQSPLAWLITTNLIVNPQTALVSSIPIYYTGQSNNLYSYVEPWGNNSNAIAGDITMPFQTWDYALYYSPTGTTLLLGARNITNTFGPGGAPPLSPGQIIRGAGQYVSVMVDPTVTYSNAQAIIFLRTGNGCVLQDLWIQGQIAPTSASSGAVTNLTIIHCNIGTSNSIDGLYGPVTSANLGFFNLLSIENTWRSAWDVSVGIISGKFYNNIWLIDGSGTTNLVGVHGFSVGSSGTPTIPQSILIRGGTMYITNAPTPAGASADTNAVFRSYGTNATFDIEGWTVDYPTNVQLISVNPAPGGRVTFTTNSFFWANGTLLVSDLNGNMVPAIAPGPTFTGNGSGLTNIVHLKTLSSANETFVFTQNTDGSSNAAITISSVPLGALPAVVVTNSGTASVPTNTANFNQTTNDFVMGKVNLGPAQRFSVMGLVSEAGSASTAHAAMLVYSNAATGVIQIADRWSVPEGVVLTLTNKLGPVIMQPNSLYWFTNDASQNAAWIPGSASLTAW